MSNEAFPNPPPEVPRPKLNWLVLLAQIFIPTIATIIAVQLRWTNAAPFIALFGGIGSGLVTGIALGLRLGRTTGARVALGFVLSGVLCVACVGMNCFGCMASGYQLNFH